MVLGSDIMTQLENAKEGIANPGQGLCLGACPENRSMVALMEKYGYNASDVNDSITFLRDYGTDDLVNKTALNITK